MTTSDTITCPHCGENISRKAAACPHCGSDERTGWSDKTYLDGIDVGDDVDYEELRAREFAGHPKRLPRWQMVTAALVLVIFIAMIVGSLI